MNVSHLKKDRLEKLEKIKNAGWSPYVWSYDRTHTIAEARKYEGKNVKIAGRLFSLRTHGNIAFGDIKDESGKIQVFFQKKLLGDEQFKNISLLDLGDFIGLEGVIVVTIAGEISIAPLSYKLLSKSLRPLPSEFFGVKDVETRFRQRYLDLLLNEGVRARFNARSRIIRNLRNYLDALGFWEVETPTLQPLYGGANAKPFITHVNALDSDVYLRIADELYLKRLLVGGYEKVYEICKDFRNEGIDNSHFPEFTMIEWYEAYADYHTMMDVAEGAFKYIAQGIFGHTTLAVDKKEIDIGVKWPRIPMVDVLKDKLGLDVENKSIEELVRYCKEECKEAKILGGETKGQLIYIIFEHTIPQLLEKPTWIIDYPEDVSPLAKAHREKAGWVERFEGYIGGKEICDGWSELTDPLVQRERLTKDTQVVRADKEEAQHVDEDFLTAMEYGMPPFGGIGIGIDRLVMFFTNTWAIKEVILFPSLRREKKESSAEDENTSQAGIMEDALRVESSFTRSDAYELLIQHLTTKNLIKHCLATEATMRSLARHFHADEERWGITGLLHDIDWDMTKNDIKKHGTLLLEEDSRIPRDIVRAVKAHNYTYTGVMPETKMEWAISCCDELTGIIVAAALIHPDKKLSSLDRDFVLKRFNTPSFAKGAHREVIAKCEEALHIPLAEFITITLEAMQGIAAAVGL